MGSGGLFSATVAGGIQATGWQPLSDSVGSLEVGTSCKELRLLTENEVQRSFRQLIQGAEIDSEMLEKADELLDQLRPESPLRHRLDMELEELRSRVPAPK